jgi:hypothetical protein
MARNSCVHASKKYRNCVSWQEFTRNETWWYSKKEGSQRLKTQITSTCAPSRGKYNLVMLEGVGHMVILSALGCETSALTCVMSYRQQVNSACEKCTMLNGSIHVQHFYKIHTPKNCYQRFGKKFPCQQYHVNGYYTEQLKNVKS